MKTTYQIIEKEIVESPISYTQEQRMQGLKEAINTLCDKIIDNLDEGYTIAPADYFGFGQSFEYEYKGWKLGIVMDSRPIGTGTLYQISIGVDVTREES